jgi:hypothetical protein
MSQTSEIKRLERLECLAQMEEMEAALRELPVADSPATQWSEENIGSSVDLRGRTPETWDCVDCGANTAPGVPSRVEMEQAFKEGKDSVPVTIDDKSEVYCVRKSIWKKAGLQPYGGCLCIGCLELRLGRQLKPKDFRRNHPLNFVPGTPRLLKRRDG